MTEEQKGRLLKAFVDIRRGFLQFSSGEQLTQGEFLVLRRIKIEQQNNTENSGGMFKAVKISEYLSMPPPAVSRIFNSLEARELIERKINKDNRRSVIVLLTKKGQETLDATESKVKKFFDRLTSHLGEEDSLKLLALLEKTLEVVFEGD